MSGDWIKVHRKMMDSAVSTDPILGHVWLQLLLRANWQRRQLKTGQWLDAGQLIIGQEKFAEDIGIGRQQLRRAIDTLTTLGNATSKPTRWGTIITIVNWRTYQQDDAEANQQTNQEPTRNQPGTNQRRRREEGKKERNTERFHPPTVEEVAAYCRERSNQIDAEAFVDFYTANGWVQGRNGKSVKDWKACVRTWEQRNKQEAKKDERPKSRLVFDD